MKPAQQQVTERKARLRQMKRWFALGIPKSEIGRRLGISRQRVHQLVGKRAPL